MLQTNTMLLHIHVLLPWFMHHRSPHQAHRPSRVIRMLKATIHLSDDAEWFLLSSFKLSVPPTHFQDPFERTIHISSSNILPWLQLHKPACCKQTPCSFTYTCCYHGFCTTGPRTKHIDHSRTPITVVPALACGLYAVADPWGTPPSDG